MLHLKGSVNFQKAQRRKRQRRTDQNRTICWGRGMVRMAHLQRGGRMGGEGRGERGGGRMGGGGGGEREDTALGTGRFTILFGRRV